MKRNIYTSSHRVIFLKHKAKMLQSKYPWMFLLMMDATDKWVTLLSSVLILEYKHVVGCTQHSVQQGSAVTE
jgi:hypothetical protein